MAQTFVKAILHKKSFLVFYSKIPVANAKQINVGAAHPAQAGAFGILGEGQGLIAGVALNACFLANAPAANVAATTTAVDPPVIYTFCNATQPYGRDFLNLNLKMVRANDYSFNIQVILNGNAVNCTGGSLRFTAKWKPQDTDGNEIFTVTSPSSGIAWINQSLGTATITIARSLTNINAIPFHKVDPVYDLQYTDSGGHVFTVMYGTLTIVPNISQTSP